MARQACRSGRRSTQGIEGPPVGLAREQPVAIDEVEQRHGLAAQGMDDVVVVDDLVVPAVADGPARAAASCRACRR